MERRDFIHKTIIASTALAATGVSAAEPKSQQENRELYEWRTYELRWGQGALDSYLTKALIPALNRLGVKKVGVFGEIGKSEPLKVFVLMAYSSFEDYGRISLELKKDKTFIDAAKEYNQIPEDQAVYSRFDSSLMIAFEGLPKMIIPENGPRIFELRTYDGYSEDAVNRKIKMFNNEEFTIFNRVKLNPVFFGEVIAGKNLPALTYMITFKNMEERERNWKAFGEDPDWQRIRQLPEYEHTVSKIYKTFLTPLPYSQI
jgi:hypothetical protein